MLSGFSSDKLIDVAQRSEGPVPAAITDIGCERDINEDRYAVIESSDSGIAWIVCDGMGGVMGGELAAQLAIDAMRRALENGEHTSTSDALREAVEEANRVIVLRRQNPAFSSMGTTIVGAMINEDEIVIAHAGDSRAYLVRDGVIQQLTVDHTYVQELVEKGVINTEDALSHPQAHVLTKCLGAEPILDLPLKKLWLWEVKAEETKDLLVLCSDGLYSHVEENEIAQAVTKSSPQECCVELVELAKARGGYDNITIAVLPLNGQLREESPGRSRAKSAAKARKAKPSAADMYMRHRSSLSPSKQIVLWFLLFIAGCVGTLALELFRIQ